MLDLLCVGDSIVEINADGYSAANWPKSCLLFTGRYVLLDFQTASNYQNIEDNDSRYGFACTITGYLMSVNCPK